MDQIQKDENRDFMRRFLTLPIVLGSLLIATGGIGYYVNRHSKRALYRYSTVVLGPTVAFGKIASDLRQVELELFRLNQQGADLNEKNTAISTVKAGLKDINAQVLEQERKSKGENYESDFAQWSKEWATFYSGTNSISENVSESDFEHVDQDISGLIKGMGRLDKLIINDVRSQLDESLVFSRKATFALFFTVFAGATIGLFSSIFIVRSIRKLFLVIAIGKRNIETLLNNLDQGFFVFDREGKIQKGVSKAAKLFLGSDPTGRFFYEALPLDQKGVESAKIWSDLTYTGALRFVDFKPLAPQSFERDGRYIELDFRPIYKSGSDEILDKVICIASDKTEERRLREKAESESAVVKLVMAVLSDRSSFVDYVIETRTTMRELEVNLESDAPDLEFLFRGMHSLKAGAAVFNMMKIVRDTHYFESKLADIRVEGQESFAVFRPELKTGLQEIKQNFESFLTEHEHIFGKISIFENRTKSLPVNVVYDLCQFLYQHLGKDSAVFLNFVRKYVQDDLGVAFKRYGPVIKGISDRQFKKVEYHAQLGSTKVFLEPYFPLVHSYVHVFRNAIDHGIEDEGTRTEAGKPPAGKIDVRFEKFEQHGEPRLRIIVEDDGQGIDPEFVKVRAVYKGLIQKEEAKKLSSDEAYQLLFANGFSTKDKISDISGRGIGLDAVMYEVTKLKGRVWIESELGIGTRVVAEVPLFESPAGYTEIESSSPSQNLAA